MKNVKYFRIIIFKNLPLYLFCLLTIFIFSYQLAIGNVFLEEIHPNITLSIFALLLFTFTYLLSSFRIKEVNNKILIRMGLYVEYFKTSEIKKVEEIEIKENYPYGIFKDNNIIVIKIDSYKKGLVFDLVNNKKVILIDKYLLKNIENLTLNVQNKLRI